ncbi:hypothetical protein [Brevifollis gellanilyticus]|uniref:Uncharacterized protein n=1 Tax=Brevifollis gellanilyticus TaxID=748831 RepID=A0A512M554_9BACT|nr:hypothetical protein [Brevifollis gellanilyticus]GEP41875.1 hypothetical protein BGE01nite_11660 [Brevifollis gellanilyticus]
MIESDIQNSPAPTAMHEVHVEIHRFIDDAQPSWVECTLRDASGREWQITDKVPTFTEAALDADSTYPQPGMVRCEIVREWTDEGGRQRCVISTAVPDAVEAVSGET